MVEAGVTQDRRVLNPLVNISKEDSVYHGLIALLCKQGWQISLEPQSNPLYETIVADQLFLDGLALIINSPDFEVVKDAVRGSMKQGVVDFEIYDRKVEATTLREEQKERAKRMFRRSFSVRNFFVLNVDMGLIHQVWEEQREFCKDLKDLLEKPIEAAQTTVFLSNDLR